MSLSPASSALSASTSAELACAEIWGGNRAINAPIHLPGIRGWVYSLPSVGGRGGDIHYVSLCSSGLLSRFCLADVAGHGEKVARVSSEIHLLLRRYMNTADERCVLTELNRRLEGSELEHMTTAAAASYLPPVRMLSVSYAGHPPGWYYRRSDDSWQRLSAADVVTSQQQPVNLPLAVDPHTSFSRRRLRVRPGDRLLLVTDGVLEAPGRQTRELFGDERVGDVLMANRHMSVEELAAVLVAALVAHTGDPELSHDDVTLLLLEFVRGPRAFGLWEMLLNRVLQPLHLLPAGRTGIRRSGLS